MSEHWKSTPKYWCKHCQCYVRDTKLERQNHDATGKHQGALKRFLRDLHRGHEREERDKERARREIDRLNGVVTGGPSSSGSFTRSAAPPEAQAKTQREQLAALGVAMPDDFRPEMALAGEWTVTNTRVIDDTPKQEEDQEDKVDTKATGVRKREVPADEKEAEDAVQRLFKKSKKWGRASRTTRQEEDDDLDALLSGSVLVKPTPDDTQPKDEVKSPNADEVKQETNMVKEEPDTETSGLAEAVKLENPSEMPALKTEDEDAGPAPVVFKKRKAKGAIRQK